MYAKQHWWSHHATGQTRPTLIFQKEGAGQMFPKMSAGAHISNLKFSPHLKDLNTLGPIHCGGHWSMR